MTFWDRLVFTKIASRFGGNVKMMLTGAEPLSPRIAEFLKIVCMTVFVEGYGLTETCAASTGTELKEIEFGTVGVPMGCVEIKLVDVVDMDYLVTDKPCPRGEIWIRGPTVFKGYFRQPNETADSMEDGWFKTGDVGMWTESGDLKIIDRKKNLFKLSQGEYIRPEYIEGVYKQSKYIANIYVHGTSLENFLLAIVVANMENVKPWAVANGLEAIADKPGELVKNDRIKRLILQSMNQRAQDEQLRGFEVVKDIHLVAEDFTVENGLLTPTFKLKRHECAKRFGPVIQQLYAQLNAAGADPKQRSEQPRAKL